MTDVSVYDQKATMWLQLAQATRARAEGTSARAMIDPMSREIGVSKSAFERLLKGRFKGVKAWLYERIRLSMIHALEAEMGRLENVLAVARLSSMAPDDDAILAAQAALKATRSLIEKVK